MDSWKERSIKRSDFRHTKSGPEIPKHRRTTKRKKEWIIEYTPIKEDRNSIFFRMFPKKRGEWLTWKKYVKEEDADKALKSIEHDGFYNKKNFIFRKRKL